MSAPATLAELKAELASRGLRLTKRFGQNFCVDPKACQAMVRDSGTGAGDVVLEVGPGAGHLTTPLLEAGVKVLAVEIDSGLYAMLQDRFKDDALTLLHADVLKSKNELNGEVLDALAAFMQTHNRDHFHVVANLPYNAGTAFLLNLAVSALPWRSATVTVQAELAGRLTARANTSQYGAASAVLQAFASVKKVRSLPPEVFWPRPEVQSAVIRAVPLENPLLDVAVRNDFSKMVTQLFSHRRKTLLRALPAEWRKQPDAEGTIRQTDLDPGARPETFSPEELAKLFTAFTD